MIKNSSICKVMYLFGLIHILSTVINLFLLGRETFQTTKLKFNKYFNRFR